MIFNEYINNECIDCTLFKHVKIDKYIDNNYDINTYFIELLKLYKLNGFTKKIQQYISSGIVSQHQFNLFYKVIQKKTGVYSIHDAINYNVDMSKFIDIYKINMKKTKFISKNGIVYTFKRTYKHVNNKLNEIIRKRYTCTRISTFFIPKDTTNVLRVYISHNDATTICGFI